MLFRYLSFVMLLSAFTPALSQTTTVLHGVVLESNTWTPVPFATVAVLNTTPLQGTVCDESGQFTLSQLPVGRYDLQCSSVGYEPLIIREVVIGTGKQTRLEIRLLPLATELATVEVRPTTQKERALNPMAVVSARTLSTEEARRFAGGFDDPARLATAFAGVAGNTGENGIIVRGNAPKFLQWRLEGIEIPSPNHFADLRSFGGGLLTALSSQVIGNSDFFTGAFPAEYSNALSGVFDMALRKGNSDQREHTLQLGIIGLDASSEGPIVKNKNATYLFNYRYSTLDLLEPLLPENAEQIKYQDLSFKIHAPTQRMGTFSIWGLGLIDAANAKAKKDSTLWQYKDDKENNSIAQTSASGGINHRLIVNNTTSITTQAAVTHLNTAWDTESLNAALQSLPQSNIDIQFTNYVFKTAIHKKFSSMHSHHSGIGWTNMNYRMILNRAIQDGNLPQSIVDASGKSHLVTAYTASTFNFGPKLELNAGLNAQYFTLNNNYTLEPRLGMKYQMHSKHALSCGLGLHSKLEQLNFYFNNDLQTGQRAVNQSLDFTKAIHAVLGYDWNISPLLHVRAEPYFQWLYQVPVVANSSFSLLNLQGDWFFAEPLVNKGNGINYGLDLTIEKYMSQGFYMLFSGALFTARYRGGDGVWRDTRFNRGFVSNFLVGKEWYLGQQKNRQFNVNLRASYQGGNRFTPVDEPASKATSTVVFDDSNAFSKQFPSTLHLHLSTSYKINKKNAAHEFSLKILNLTRQPDQIGFKYNFLKKQTERDFAYIVLPNLSYKIEF